MMKLLDSDPENQKTAQQAVDQPVPRHDDELIHALSRFVEPIGYRIIHVEVQNSRQKSLKIFIDHQESLPGRAIGIEDCAKVSRALDEPLDTDPELQRLFHGSFELEVSSPGMDRPLRTARDFIEFSGHRVRIHTFRPLTAGECGNLAYHQKNPKQKHFLGKLLGFHQNNVEITLTQEEKKEKKKVHSKKKSKSEVNGATSQEESKSEEGRITIPLQLISKANLEPEFSFEESEERE
ncbi:MAG: hypothetical protein HYX41_00355 [Bdellovibrio sp.]|nr:hypothetical protein [Bdellovibrio sp.]